MHLRQVQMNGAPVVLRKVGRRGSAVGGAHARQRIGRLQQRQRLGVLALSLQHPRLDELEYGRVFERKVVRERALEHSVRRRVLLLAQQHLSVQQRSRGVAGVRL